MIFLITVLLVTVLMAVVFTVLMLARTPRYRLEAKDLIELLRRTLANEATADEWNLKTSVPFRHDEQLEAARQHCLEIESEFWQGGEKLFRRDGLVELRTVLDRLEIEFPLVAKQSSQSF